MRARIVDGSRERMVRCKAVVQVEHRVPLAREASGERDVGCARAAGEPPAMNVDERRLGWGALEAIHVELAGLVVFAVANVLTDLQALSTPASVR